MRILDSEMLTLGIVNNDFHENDEIYRLFDDLTVEDMGTELKVDPSDLTNGTTDSSKGNTPNGTTSEAAVNGVGLPHRPAPRN